MNEPKACFDRPEYLKLLWTKYPVTTILSSLMHTDFSGHILRSQKFSKIDLKNYSEKRKGNNGLHVKSQPVQNMRQTDKDRSFFTPQIRK